LSARYWDNYAGSDVNGDGIGDTPHNFGTYNDDYPLITPSENYAITEEGPVVRVPFPDLFGKKTSILDFA